MSIDGLFVRRALPRALLGLALGALLGLAHVQFGLGLVFLVGLSALSAILPIGLGLARFPIALAIWLGQYSVFWLRVMAPARSNFENAGILYIINGIQVYMPAIAILSGTYLGMLVEKNRRASEDAKPSPPAPLL